MSYPGFGDIVLFVDLANRIYEYGFTKAKRAPLLYNEFGENVKHLAANLADLQKVVGSIRGDGLSQSVNSVSLGSLPDVIGNYQMTLQDCDKLLRDNVKFSWREDFIHNVIWNFTVASDIQGLKDRLAFLNIKILTILKTLDLEMAHKLKIGIFRIHRDLASRIDGARDDIIQQLECLRADIFEVFTGSTNAVGSSSRPRPAPLVVPASLESLFEQQIQSFNDGQLPLVRGLDAVVYHINAATTTPIDDTKSKIERQWLELAKGFWIITRVRAGQEYINACSFRPSDNFEKQMNDMGITIASYVRGLENELRETAKALGIDKFTPDWEIILGTFHDNPEILPECARETTLTPSWDLEYSEKIMDVSLNGPYRGFDQSLRLFRLTEIDLKLVLTDVRRNSGISGERNNNTMNVDLQRLCYIPLYATSKSSSSALNVNFQGDRLAAGITALSFTNRPDLFKFQQAITGYQVVSETIDIQVISYASSWLFGSSRQEYTGRLQLWWAKRSKNWTKDGATFSRRSSGSPSVVEASSPTSAPGSPNSKRVFDTSKSDVSSPDRRDSAMNMTSRMSLKSRTSTTTTLSSAQALLKSSASTTIIDKEGNMGIMLEKPESPMLVLYLEQSKGSSTPQELSFLAIQLDEDTHIDTSACECCRPGNKCVRTVIQRSGGKPLFTHHHDAGTKLDAWNLAMLGQWQREWSPSSKDRMRWVAVDFKTVKDRTRFEEKFEQLKKLLIRQQSAYHTDLRNLRF